MRQPSRTNPGLAFPCFILVLRLIEDTKRRLHVSFGENSADAESSSTWLSHTFDSILRASGVRSETIPGYRLATPGPGLRVGPTTPLTSDRISEACPPDLLGLG